MNRREPRNPHYFIFNQSVSCKSITASVWAHSEGLQSDYGDGRRIIRTMAGCVFVHGHSWGCHRFIIIDMLHYLAATSVPLTGVMLINYAWVDHPKIRKMLAGVNIDIGWLFNSECTHMCEYVCVCARAPLCSQMNPGPPYHARWCPFKSIFQLAIRKLNLKVVNVAIY